MDTPCGPSGSSHVTLRVCEFAPSATGRVGSRDQGSGSVERPALLLGLKVSSCFSGHNPFVPQWGRCCW